MSFFLIVRLNEMRQLTEAQSVTARRLVELAPGIQPLIEELLLRSCETFGREPGPDGPILFDPEAESPIPLTAERLNKAELDEWTDAIEEAQSQIRDKNR